ERGCGVGQRPGLHRRGELAGDGLGCRERRDRVPAPLAGAARRVPVEEPGDGEHVAAAMVDGLERAFRRRAPVDEVADGAAARLPAQGDLPGAGLRLEPGGRREGGRNRTLPSPPDVGFPVLARAAIRPQ
ncbi:MAG: hypothetical protein ACRDM9_10140, partial [Gaiellaceae bacterium]